MQVEYSSWYSDPDEDVFTINLLITLTNMQRFRLIIGGSGMSRDHTSVEDIFNNLANRIRGDFEPEIKISAIEALIRFTPQNLNLLREATEHDIADIRADAKWRFTGNGELGPRFAKFIEP